MFEGKAKSIFWENIVTRKGVIKNPFYSGAT